MGASDHSPPPGRSLAFKLVCKSTKPGEHVRVVGSIPALGNWSPQQSTVELTTTATTFPTWRSAWLPLPLGQGQFEYKYVICKDHGQDPRWEGRENRRLKPPSGLAGLEVTETFDSCAPPVEVEHIASRLPAVPEEEVECAKIIAPSAAPVQPPASAPVSFRRDISVVVPKDEDGSPALSDLSSPAASQPNSCKGRDIHLPNASSISPTSARSPKVDEHHFDRPAPVRRSSTCASRDKEMLLLDEDESPSRRIRRRTTCIGIGLELESFTLARGTGGEEGLVREAPQPLKTESRPDRTKGRKHTHRRMSKFFAQAWLPTRIRGCWSSFASRWQDDCGRTQSNSSVSPPEEEESKESKDAYEEAETEAGEADSNDDQAEHTTSDEEHGRESDGQEDYDANAHDARTFDEAYEVHAKIGEGAYGAVHLCAKRGKSKELACKVINKERLCSRDVVLLFGDSTKGSAGEISIQMSLPRHHNIVALHCFFEEPQVVRLVMDLCSGGDLFDEILRCSERRREESQGEFQGPFIGLDEHSASSTARQLLLALEFLHGRGVVHRDVKPENVLFEKPLSEVPVLDGNRLKLCDFGFAAHCTAEDGNVLGDRCGSLSYVAPEVLHMGRLYGQKVDIWSAGAVLFSTLRASLPINAANDQILVQMARLGNVQYDRGWDLITPEAKSAVQAMLIVDESERPTAAEARAHPFLQEA